MFGKVSWVKDDSQVGLIVGDLSWAIDNAKIGIVIGDVSWVTGNAHIFLVIGKKPQIKDNGRVDFVMDVEFFHSLFKKEQPKLVRPKDIWDDKDGAYMPDTTLQFDF